MSTLDPLNDLMRAIWNDVQSGENKRISQAAKASPREYKDSNVMAGSTRYLYYQIAQGKRTVRFCWSLHKNVAGYYLSFIEIIEGRVGGRAAFIGWKTKKEAIANCRARYFDSKKPKAEQRYTIPTHKQLSKRKKRY